MSQEVNPSYSGEVDNVDIAKAKAPKILNREELVKAIVDHKKTRRRCGREDLVGSGDLWNCFTIFT